MTPQTPLGAVILAAGMSTRMGSPKALLDLDGRPLICRILDTLRKRDQIGQVIIVTGHESDRIRKAVTDSGVAFVHNADYQTGGMLSSVKAGIGAVAKGTEAFFLVLLDQPLVRAETLISMTLGWQSKPTSLVVPRHMGKRGHPILVATRRANSVLSLPAGSSLRDFVAQCRDETVEVEVTDPGVLSVMDTPEDYQTVLRQWRTNSCPTVPVKPA